MHLKLDSGGSIDDGDVARDLGQDTADIVILSAADSDLAAFGAAHAALPANSTLTNGAGVFGVTLTTIGNQTVTATDTLNASITGTSNTIIVGTGIVSQLLLVATPIATVGTPVSVTVAALDQFSNPVTTYTGTVHFTSSDPLAVLPANSGQGLPRSQRCASRRCTRRSAPRDTASISHAAVSRIEGP